MLYHASQHGVFDLKTALLETMDGFSRAGKQPSISESVRPCC
jgi:delta-aminolevulinic acid dehydratase/porphobilinogen synthase